MRERERETERSQRVLEENDCQWHWNFTRAIFIGLKQRCEHGRFSAGWHTTDELVQAPEINSTCTGTDQKVCAYWSVIDNQNKYQTSNWTCSKVYMFVFYFSPQLRTQKFAISQFCKAYGNFHRWYSSHTKFKHSWRKCWWKNSVFLSFVCILLKVIIHKKQHLPFSYT